MRTQYVLIGSMLLLSAVIIVVAGISVARAVDLPTHITVSICGNGILDPGEVCDDGAAFNTGAYASSTATRHCLPNCQGYGPYCGDNILQTRFVEECDFGSSNGTGGLCSATCKSLPPVPPAGTVTGSPPRGSTPDIPGASPGSTLSELPTKVVLRGKAFPNSTVSILLDGKSIGSVLADSNADFLFTTTNVTPGTATFSFSAKDARGIDSILSSSVFEVVQSAVTTEENIFIPPTISVSDTTIDPHGLFTLAGQTVPLAQLVSEIHSAATTSLSSQADSAGLWALQVDASSLAPGYHSAKAYFQLTPDSKSGFGKSINFFIGTGSAPGQASTDLNGDKKVNLVDFSIFLTDWGTDAARSDFNGDHTVNLADFSILLFNWTG